MSSLPQDDATGFHVVPQRYDVDGREAIDIIRDSMSDTEFAAYCMGNARKYRLREGKKDSPDAEKARWYEEMAAHVLTGSPDPRSARQGFTGYRRQAIPEPRPRRQIDVLDHGFVRLVETWGEGDARLSEAGIIEAARQSTQGSFRGWENGDARLLRFLHENKHASPFEFAGAVLEVRAPIFVFREWHRHRTQSFNEMSARYAPVPDVHYVPSVDRLMRRDDRNKQAGAVKGAATLDEAGAVWFRSLLERAYADTDTVYQRALAAGVPKELARCIMPVGRYSQMRASANLRNWLGFLALRMDSAAQWEIRQYAGAVHALLSEAFPRVMALFDEGAA